MKEEYDPGISLHTLHIGLSFCVPQIGCFQNIESVDLFREKIRMGELPSDVKCIPYVILRSFTHPHDLAHSKMSMTLDRGRKVIVLWKYKEEGQLCMWQILGSRCAYVKLYIKITNYVLHEASTKF